MDLLIVQWCQSFRNPFWDMFFTILTELGGETVFLVVACTLYWTIDQKFAYRFMMFFLYGVAFNSLIKFFVNRPRPYMQYPETIHSIGEATSGKSFPSSHSQNIAITSLILIEKGSEKNKPRMIFFFWILVGLVSFSRIYLGQHYLSDVLAGLFFSYVIYKATNWLCIHTKITKHHLASAFLIVFLTCMIFNQDKNLYVSIAGIIGTSLGFRLEQRFVRYKPQAKIGAQILKIMIGLTAVLTLRFGLKWFFEKNGLYSFDYKTHPATLDLLLDFFRYFIICLWVSLGAPWIFKKYF